MFHGHYCSEDHLGIENWSVSLIDQVKDLNSLKKKELSLIDSLKAWDPNDLNLREVYEAYNLDKKGEKNQEKLKMILHTHTHENVC